MNVVAEILIVLAVAIWFFFNLKYSWSVREEKPREAQEE